MTGRKSDPWRVPIAVGQIAETGLQKTIVANTAELHALAAAGDLRDVTEARATLTLTPAGGGKVHVTGRVTVRAGQTCVVTLDPIESLIDEPIDLVFAPAGQIPPLASTIEAGDDDETTPDLPEPIENGMIDIGRVATDAFFLAIDPYPRKHGVAFEPPFNADDPHAHPFAALASLKRSSD